MRRWPCWAAALAVASSLAHARDTPPGAPRVDANTWLLIDHHSGAVLAEEKADSPVAPASLTKLMAAYLIFRRLRDGELKLGDEVVVSERAAAAVGSRLFLRPGDRVKVETLLTGMIVNSANDATRALAEHAFGSETEAVEAMNAQARAWGLRNTRFISATGLDSEGHHSSARELSFIAQALMQDFPERYPLFALKSIEYGGITQYNRNALLWRDGGADGVKTGRTRSAGHCLIASAMRDGMRLIATVLGARDEAGRVAAAEALLAYGFEHFETRRLYGAEEPATKVRVWFGEDDVLPLGAGRDLYLTLPRGEHARLRARLTVKEKQFAPVRRGQAVGTLAFDVEHTQIAEYPLVALKDISRGNFLERAIDRVRLWFE